MDIIHIYIKEVLVQSVCGGKSEGHCSVVGDTGLLGSCTVSWDLRNIGSGGQMIILLSWIRKTKPSTTMVNWMGRLCLWSADVVN